MKRIFIIVTLVGSSFFMSSYANGGTANPSLNQVFQSSFADAKEVRWQQAGEMYKAFFILDGEYRTAFYTTDGELVAVTKNLASTQLPVALQAGLKKGLAGAWITDLFSVTVEGQNTYYVKLENATTTVMLKSAGPKKWINYRKADK